MSPTNAATPGGRPGVRGSSKVQADGAGTIVRRGADTLPVADASVAAPAAGRSMAAAIARCPHCKAVHLHRGRSVETLDGAVRAGCGRKYVLRVRRVYRPAVTA